MPGVFLHRRSVLVEARVWSLLVVVGQPGADQLAGLGAIVQIVQLDALVLQRAPEPFDEDVVHPPALATHRATLAGSGAVKQNQT